ncbi:hypothetical protein FB451DRAFT_1190770 [Mycena latifolia]|nr:hypothetical protein FB451DRAFT_1190770 [Mycena latifolia]
MTSMTKHHPPCRTTTFKEILGAWATWTKRQRQQQSPTEIILRAVLLNTGRGMRGGMEWRAHAGGTGTATGMHHRELGDQRGLPQDIGSYSEGEDLWHSGAWFIVEPRTVFSKFVPGESVIFPRLLLGKERQDWWSGVLESGSVRGALEYGKGRRRIFLFGNIGSPIKEDLRYPSWDFRSTSVQLSLPILTVSGFAATCQIQHGRAGVKDILKPCAGRNGGDDAVSDLQL